MTMMETFSGGYVMERKPKISFHPIGNPDFIRRNKSGGVDWFWRAHRKYWGAWYWKSFARVPNTGGDWFEPTLQLLKIPKKHKK